MGCAGLGCNMRRACTRRRHWAWISPPYLPAASKHPVSRLHPLAWACDCHCACVALCCKSTQRLAAALTGTLQLATASWPCAGSFGLLPQRFTHSCHIHTPCEKSNTLTYTC